MKISRLEIHDALGITEFELSPEKITLIQGKNESGKTSILEGIERALYRKDRRVDFVRKGEKEATLYVGLDDGTKIDKKVTADGDTRGKVTKEGVAIPKPETYLRSITGEYAFNPIDFLEKTGKEQAQILLSLIPMRITREDLEKWTGEVPPVNLEDHAIMVLEYLAEKYFYDKRTTANAELKDVKNQIESLRAQLPDNYNPEEWKDIELYELHEKVRSAEEHNGKIIDAKLFVEEFNEKQKEVIRKYDLEKMHRLAQDETRLTEIQEEIDRLNLEISSIKGKQAEAIDNIEKERKAILDNLDNILNDKKEFLASVKTMPVDELKTEAKKAEEMKGYLNLAENLKKLEKDETGKEDEAKRLDKVVELLRKKPADLLSKVTMPIKGLGINDQMQVTIDDLPISNLSTSRQITLAIEIARVTSGELKTICIDRYETLDTEHQKIFMDEISKDDFQYFITEVTSGPLKVTSMKGSQ
ncbi:MAG: hypothetical protein A2Z35_04940 [Actinobacteria bacterium RBG_19FT_COMBO_36_27]|nr:MAG: hypothetical protein A2Z35_04940 [Actinobacteria bacterium RBG_19FT_COMBO_36_27]